MKRFLFFLGALWLWGGLTACNAASLAPSTAPLAIGGVLDLRHWDFTQSSSSLNLNGEWEFYWGQLLTVTDFSTTTPPTMTGVINVPRSWRGYLVDGQPLSGEGYATYRLTVLLDPTSSSRKILALKLPLPINTAHRLYVDGQLVGAAGQVGATAETMTPQQVPYLVMFAPTSAKIEILLQISNFYLLEGGIIQPIGLGPPAQLQQRDEDQWGRDFFLMGSIFIMGLYHLLLFALRRRDKSPLYFGLFCLLVTGTMLLLQQPQIFTDHFSPSWELYARTVFGMGSAVMFVQAVFFHTLFPPEAARRVLHGLLGVVLLLIILAVLLPQRALTFLVFPLSGYLLAVSLDALWIVVQAVRHQRAEARIALLGYLPLLITGLNDVVTFSQRTQAEPWVLGGLFSFIVAQAYLLSARFSRAFTQTEILSEDLRRSEEKYRTLFEDSKDLIFITALDGRIEAINPACFEVLGYTHAEALHLNAADFYANPSDRLRFQEAIAPTGAVTDFPVIVRHKDGQDLECQLTATVRLDPLGQPMGYQGILHDLTAYKQAEAHRQRVWALQDLNQSLEQRVEDRTLALTQASAALQAEIEQRQSHQQEKERLLALAEQQSEHLRAMSKALLGIQHLNHQDQAAGLDEDLRQKMANLRQNLTALQALAGFEQNLNLVAYVSDTTRLLAEVEIYVEQVTVVFDEANPSIDPLVGNPLLQLSSRERQVLKLMAEGKSNPEIANLLTIRLNTVHTYLKRIRNKLDIQDTPGLINFARNNGLLK